MSAIFDDFFKDNLANVNHQAVDKGPKKIYNKQNMINTEKY